MTPCKTVIDLAIERKQNRKKMHMKTDTQQQTKHTAGPWTVENDNRDDCMMTIRSSGAGRLGVAYCGKYDASLIAAAPDLLDALMVIAKQADTTAATFPNAPGRLDWKQVAAIARAAIAKAGDRA